MSSSGNYYYRYKGVYYNLPSAQLDLARAYDPVKKENYFESKLYTTWKLKLTRESNAKIAFDSLLEKCIECRRYPISGCMIYPTKPSSKFIQYVYQSYFLSEVWKIVQH